MLIELLKRGLPLFFASTNVIADGGGADADAGGGADTGGGDDGTITDDTSDSGADGADIADGTDADDAEITDDNGEDADAEADRGAQPTFGEREFKKALAKLREVDPKAAEAAQKAFYKAQDYAREFGSVREARAARELLETVGGPEGVTQLQGEAKNYADELMAMAKGDTAIVDELANDYPESLATLAPYALSKLEAINPDKYARFAGGLVAKTLAEKGVSHSFLRLRELISDGKQTEALKLADELYNWDKNINQFAKTQPEQKPGESREAKEVRERAQELDRRESESFQGDIAKQIIGSMNAAIKRQLAPYLKRKKFNAEQTQRLISDIRSHMSDGFKINKGYQARMREMLKDRDSSRIMRYVNGQLDGKTVLRSVKAVWALRGYDGGGAARTAQNGDRVASVTGQKPDPATIDWSKDPQRKRYIGDGQTGEATLKGGKVVKWRW